MHHFTVVISAACMILLVNIGTASQLAPTTRQIFNFSSVYVDIENSHLRPNGHLLLSTFENASLFTLDPSSATPQAELIAELPGATALCGIATIGVDKFAVVGGVRGSYHYDNETIYTIDFSNNATNATIKAVATIANASMLNGMDSLPTYPHVLMIADSRLGAVFRVDTETGISEIAFSDVALNATANATVPIGINGLKVFGGYVYFSNTARNTFGRVPISDAGEKIGDIEIVATLNTTSELGLGVAYDWDDFVFDKNGTAYIAQPSNAISTISPDGEQSIFVGGENSTAIVGPTSVTLSLDQKTAYVTTRGGAVGDFTYSGQIVEVELV